MADAKPKIVQDITRRNRQYITYSDGTQWARKIDPQTGKPLGELKQLESPPQAGPEPLQLHVFTEFQAEGEPEHWSLHATRADSNGTLRGQLCSDSFSWHQTLNSNLGDSDYAKVGQVARSEPPPQARNRKEVMENCQGWTIRVLERLASEGIVNEDTIATLRGQMDLID